MRSQRPVFATLTAALTAALLLAGCGAQPPAPTTAHPPARQEAIVRIGDTTLRGSAVQTSMLDAGVARQYGIHREPGTVMLLVTVRQGADGDEAAAPVRVTATATDLRGRRQTVAMRELRVADPGPGPGPVLLDYVGTVQTTLPDTLRFDVTIVRDGGATASLQFSRELFAN